MVMLDKPNGWCTFDVSTEPAEDNLDAEEEGGEEESAVVADW